MYKAIVTTSWDDGHVLDLKLAELLKKYGIKGTFYVSPEDRELQATERLQKGDVQKLAEDFEIGAHTLTHPYLPAIDAVTARKEIVASKEVLEEWTSRPVTSFCYPKGGYLPEHEKMVRDAGFARARTVKRFALTRGDDRYAEPTSIHTYNHWSDAWSLLVFVKFNLITFFLMYRRWDLQAIALFERMLKRGGVFHLWGHSWEVENNADWQRLENVLKYISNREEVRYVSNDGVA